MNDEPTRLLDELADGSAMRADLEAAQADQVDYDVAAGLAAFTAAAGAGGAAAVAAKSSVKPLLMWLLGIGGVAAVGFGYLSTRPDPEEAAMASRADSDTTAAVPDQAEAFEPKAQASVESPSGPTPSPLRTGTRPAEIPAETAEPAEPAGDKHSEARQPTSKAETKQPKAEKENPAAPASDPRVREAMLVGQLRAAAKSDPKRALDLVARSRSEFPSGSLVQERDGYEVLALVALGRASEARAAAGAYLSRFPKGTLAGRVRDAIESLP